MPGTPGHKMVSSYSFASLAGVPPFYFALRSFGVRTVLATPEAGSTIQFNIYLAIEDPDDESTVAPTAETR
jgi:hypothetical protein